MDDYPEARRFPSSKLRWVLRVFCVLAGAAIVWALAATVSHAVSLIDQSSKSSSDSGLVKALSKQAINTTNQTTQTTSKIGRSASSKATKALPPTVAQPVKKSVNKVVGVVTKKVGKATQTIEKVVDKSLPAHPGIVPPVNPAKTPVGDLTPLLLPPGVPADDPELIVAVAGNPSSVSPVPTMLIPAHNGGIESVGVPVTPQTSNPNVVGSGHSDDLAAYFTKVAATITNSVNQSTPNLVGILPLAMACIFGFLCLGRVRELRGGVVKRPYLVPVTPD